MINVYQHYENLFHSEPYLSKGKTFSQATRKKRIEIECEALERYQAGTDPQAGLELLLYAWGFLVRECTRMLKSFAYPGISMDDILHEAICAYLLAAHKFTCAGHARFVYYGIQYTRAILHRYIRGTIKSVTIPYAHYRERSFNIKEIPYEQIMNSYCTNPEDMWTEMLDKTSRGDGAHAGGHKKKNKKTSKPGKPAEDQ